jgi:hypothetical protein
MQASNISQVRHETPIERIFREIVGRKMTPEEMAALGVKSLEKTTRPLIDVLNCVNCSLYHYKGAH